MNAGVTSQSKEENKIAQEGSREDKESKWGTPCKYM